MLWRRTVRQDELATLDYLGLPFPFCHRLPASCMFTPVFSFPLLLSPLSHTNARNIAVRHSYTPSRRCAACLWCCSSSNFFHPQHKTSIDPRIAPSILLPVFYFYFSRSFFLLFFIPCSFRWFCSLFRRFFSLIHTHGEEDEKNLVFDSVSMSLSFPSLTFTF